MIEMGIADKTLHRLIKYLTAEGWSAQKILDLIDKLTE